MSLSSYAKRKALDFARDTFKQAHPDKNVESGSPIRALLLKPFSLIYASVFQNLESLRRQHLGNYDQISESAMDQLAENLLESRPQGSRSVGNVRVFLSSVQSFSIRTFPYFSKSDGVEYIPVDGLSFTVDDIREKNGTAYVDIPVISRAFGPESSAAAGDITNVTNFPVDVVRVTNPQPTSGGDAAMTNAEFFNYLQDAINGGTISQAGGVRQWITDEYPELSNTRVVGAGDPRQMRDEVWKNSAGNPVLSHHPDDSDVPYTDFDNLTIDFNQKPGRVVATSGTFSDDHVDRRIFVDNDIERYRTVLKKLSDTEAIISGPDLPGDVSFEQDARIPRSDGPHVRNTADVYTYGATLFVKSSIVDNRFFLETTSSASEGDTSVDYDIRDNYTYASIPGSGDAVFLEGAEGEFRVSVTSVDTDNQTLTLGSGLPEDVESGAEISLYDQAPISIRDEGDIQDMPLIYIVAVEKLDPITFDTLETIEKTQPGPFDGPGWMTASRISDREFSPKEDKEIRLLEKSDLSAFQSFDEGGVGIVDSSYVGTSDTLQKGGPDFDNTEGRVVTINVPELKVPSIRLGWARLDANFIDQEKIEIDKRRFHYFAEKGFTQYDGSTNSITIKTYDSGGTNLNTLEDSEVKVYGKTIESTIGGVFSTAMETVSIDMDSSTKASSTIEAAVIRATTNQIEVDIEDGGLPAVYDGQDFYTSYEITMPDASGDFHTNPIRVVYGTHPDIQDIQDQLDDGNIRDLCESTLARSMNPTLIDTAIQYSGSASAETIRSRFIDLIQNSVQEFEDEVQLSLSNVVAALDEEGLTDSVELDFEVKLTHFLSDGQRKIQYVNPDPETKQEIAIKSDVSPGDHRIHVTEPDVQPTGRGKLFLGGNNPNTQEVLPYEGIVENDDGTLDVIVRGGFSADHNHPKWEDVIIAVRDFEPEFEINNDTIKIPENNRPYVREIVIEKV